MTDIKEKVYDNIHIHNGTHYASSNGITGFLYRKLLRFNVSRYQCVYNLLPSGTEKLLDLGCGDGGFIFSAQDKFKEFYGVDVSPLVIQHAKSRTEERTNCDNVHFYNCDLDESLPFEDSFFDAISCISVLEHVVNPPAVLDEVHRVLKLGGTFVLQVPNFAWMPYRFQLLIGRLPKTGGVYLGADWEHLHNFTTSVLFNLVTPKGFELKTTLCSGIFAKYRRWYPSTLGADLVMKCVKV